MPSLRQALLDLINQHPDEDDVGPASEPQEPIEAPAIEPDQAQVVPVPQQEPEQAPDLEALVNAAVEARLAEIRPRRAPMPTADTEPDIDRMTVDERATYYRDTVLPGLLKDAELARR